MSDFCPCGPDDDCNKFAAETFSGKLGEIAEGYRKRLWHATSGYRLDSDSELIDLKNKVAQGLGLFGQPLFGECGRKFTIKVLVYRTYQGTPHAATAMALLPSFGQPGNEEAMKIPPLKSIVNTVRVGDVDGEYEWEFDIDLVWPSGSPPEGYVADNRSLTPNELQIWERWSRKLAGEIMGEPGAWDRWPHQDVAPAPSAARIDEPKDDEDIKDTEIATVADRRDSEEENEVEDTPAFGFSTWTPLSASSHGSSGPPSTDGGTPPSSEWEDSDSSQASDLGVYSPTPDMLQRGAPFNPAAIITSARVPFYNYAAGVTYAPTYPAAYYQWYVAAPNRRHWHTFA